jgi:hypothetical protein
MTVDLMTAPTREELARLIGEAIAHREPQDISGCCWRDALCESHDDAFSMAGVLRLVLAEVEAAGTTAEALEVIRSLAPQVIAEITGATKNEDVIAAIEGGAGGQK